MLDSKLVTIYLSSTHHVDTDEHLNNYINDGWEISEMCMHTSRVGVSAVKGWLAIKLTRPKENRWKK